MHVRITQGIPVREHSPLTHQSPSVFFSIQTRPRSIIHLRYYREDLDRKPRKGRACVCIVHGLGHPLALLRCNVRGGRDLLGGINQEKDKDFPVTRFCGILQVERLDLVLIQVRERDASVSLDDHVACPLE